MPRYLLYLSYIGAGFSGMQAQSLVKHGKSIVTIQKVLEDAVNVLRPSRSSRVVCSSRTDTGVNALCSTAHVDLVPRNSEMFCPKVVTAVMNHYLLHNGINVRIIKTRRVSNSFSAIYNAKSRTYVYRLAVSDSKDIFKYVICQSLWEERKSLCLKAPPFDLSNVVDAIPLLNGTLNFTSFRNIGGKERDPVRTLKLDIKQSTGILQEHCSNNITDRIQFYDLLFHSKGFLYKQVRRITGALCQVGYGKMTADDIKYLLDNPQDVEFASKMAVLAPPYALYLKNVEYDEKDMELPNETEDEQSTDDNTTEVFHSSSL